MAMIFSNIIFKRNKKYFSLQYAFHSKLKIIKQALEIPSEIWDLDNDISGCIAHGI